jgi:hypothetical protein
MTEREATLDELLSEPIIRKVMANDGVRAADVRRLVQQASERPGREVGSRVRLRKLQPAFDFPHAAGPAAFGGCGREDGAESGGGE